MSSAEFAGVFFDRVSQTVRQVIRIGKTAIGRDTVRWPSPQRGGQIGLRGVFQRLVKTLSQEDGIFISDRKLVKLYQ